MKSVLFTLSALVAGPAAAHEAGGVFHFHPHGGEAWLVGLALAAAVAVWFVRRRG